MNGCAHRRVHIITYGCQMNVYDSRRILQILQDAGYEETSDPTMADVILINTCSVREKPERKVMTTIARLAPLKEQRPDILIGVCGCVGQQYGVNLLKKIPALDLVIGPDNIGDLPDMLEKRERTAHTGLKIPREYEFIEVDPRYEPGPTAFLTIMKGCDKLCSFCIVPYLRGREVSKPPEMVIREVKGLIGHGVKEITLLGQNVNSYGKDLGINITFSDLLEMVDEIPNLFRLRFVTSHPADADERMLSLFGKLKTLAEYLHLPIQSGSDQILLKMRRGYTANQYLSKIETVRKYCPDIALSTDIIIGFPGETKQDFEETMRVVEECRFDQMFVFKYSPRPMTVASRMKDDVTPEEKADRMARLLEVQSKIEKERAQRFVGRIEEILVEGLSNHAGKRKGIEMMGRTRTNKIVNFQPEEEKQIEVGSVVKVRIEEALPHCLRGVIVKT